MNGLLALAFAAGMLAPINPCGFALLPAWITYTLSDPGTSPVAVRLVRALRAGAALTLGFAGTLAGAGLVVSAGARTLTRMFPWLGLAVGIILLLIGVLMLTGRGAWLRLRLPTPAYPTAGDNRTGAAGLIAVGAGYAAASLSCSFAVLLAIIGQAQATASYAVLFAVFASYAIGSAAVLMLVSIATAAAGVALSGRLSLLARHFQRVTAALLIVTGGYLSWYWYPAATGGGPAAGNVFAQVSAAASGWISGHTTLIAILAVAAVLAVAAAALHYRLRVRRVATSRRSPTVDPPALAGNPTPRERQ